MQTKLIFYTCVLMFSLLFSCSDDDDVDEVDRTGSIKFEVTVDGINESEITMLIDDRTEKVSNVSFPFIKVYSDELLTSGKVLQLKFVDMSPRVGGVSYSHTLELKTSINNEVVKSETFMLTENSIANPAISYILP